MMLRCPHCAHPFEQLRATVDTRRQARVGSRVICERCLRMSIVSDMGRSMRTPTKEEQREYPTHLKRAAQLAPPSPVHALLSYRRQNHRGALCEAARMTTLWMLAEDGRTPIRARDTLQWGEWFEHADRILAQTEIPGGIVSTVFLGIDHNFGSGRPLLWESMIFMDGNSDIVQQRYGTYEEAARGHGELVKRARGEEHR